MEFGLAQLAIIQAQHTTAVMLGADFQVEIHLALERNRRKIQESVLLSNVHKYFFLPITMCQISGKNFGLKCWFPNLSKYL